MSAQSFIRGYQGRPARSARVAGTPGFRVPSGVTTLLALLVAAAFGALHVLNPMTIPIRHVEINGEFTHLSPEVLQSVAENVVRGGFFNVNVDAVRRAVLDEPWVRDVTVRRVWPQSLNLAVQEQKPAARWGEDALLNEDGVPFMPDRSTFPAGLPALTGPAGTEQLLLERYRFVVQVLAGHGLEVVELRLSERRAWSMRLSTGQEIILGRMNFVERVRRFAAAARRDPAQRLHNARIIDMRYTNGFAVQWQGSADAMEAVKHGEAH
ncbi:MAG: FtsQ-type POTRA domain-containing protein [Gammaproteobacteria bacterium]|nr:FtsQ-type POTRA domain-containing protein [Gammaproteobacteria bacterium]